MKEDEIIRKHYQTEYIQFTEEQKQRAANTDLAAFLISQGENLKRCGSEMLWEAGGRVTIRDNIWYSQYEQKGGNAVQFVQKYYNKSYQDAVQMLLDEHIEPISIDIQKKQTKKKPFELPASNESMKQIFAYLFKSRFLDRDVVKYFVDKDLIYESNEIIKGKEIHNCVFVGVDKNGKARHAHKRGTYTLGDSYKGNVDGCEAEYSFHHTGTSNVLYVFEAPIDMLSYISLHKNNWIEHSYVSLCSVSDRAIIQMLKDNPQIAKVCLCLDNDEAGIESNYRIRHHLNEIGYGDVTFIRPKYKDWNEILKAMNGVKPLSAVPHLTFIKMSELINNTVQVAIRNKPLDFYYKTICYDYQQLMNANTNDGIVCYANRLATDTVRMAKGFLLADEKKLKQRLFKYYLPHTDKSCIENKFKKLNMEMKLFEKLFNPMQMRMDKDLEEDIQCVFKIACNSLQIQSQIENAETENIVEEQEGSDEPCRYII